MEEAYFIFDYLPYTYKSDEEEEYIQFLWDAFVRNYEAGIYQFSYIQFHMLFMTYVYHTLWKVKTNYYEKYKIAISFSSLSDVDRTMLLDGEASPLSFSLIDESRVFTLFEFVGIDRQLLGDLKDPVKTRNKLAHASGKKMLNSSKDMDVKIGNYISLINRIHLLMKPLIQSIYEQFLIDSRDIETRDGSADNEEQVKEFFIRLNYLSKKDIECCMTYDINKLVHLEGFETIKDLHDELTKIVGVLV